MKTCPVCHGDRKITAIGFGKPKGTAVTIDCPVCHGEGELPEDSMHFETPERNERLAEQNRRMAGG